MRKASMLRPVTLFCNDDQILGIIRTGWKGGTTLKGIETGDKRHEILRPRVVTKILRILSSNGICSYRSMQNENEKNQ